MNNIISSVILWICAFILCIAYANPIEKSLRDKNLISHNEVMKAKRDILAFEDDVPQEIYNGITWEKISPTINKIQKRSIGGILTSLKNFGSNVVRSVVGDNKLNVGKIARNVLSKIGNPGSSNTDPNASSDSDSSDDENELGNLTDETSLSSDENDESEESVNKNPEPNDESNESSS